MPAASNLGARRLFIFPYVHIFFYKIKKMGAFLRKL